MSYKKRNNFKTYFFAHFPQPTNNQNVTLRTMGYKWLLLNTSFILQFHINVNVHYPIIRLHPLKYLWTSFDLESVCPAAPFGLNMLSLIIQTAYH